MTTVSQRKRIWGWYFFDWASQPYNTLILTFIFGPYFTNTLSANLMESGMAEEAARAQAQASWGWGLAITGILIAVAAPLLGAIADNSGRKMPWIRVFSLMYFVGSGALWWTAPQDFSVLWALTFFGIGLIGMEFATIWNSYGVSVTVVEMLGRIVPNEDQEISAALQKEINKQGIKTLVKSKVTKVEVLKTKVNVSVETFNVTRPPEPALPRLLPC